MKCQLSSEVTGTCEEFLKNLERLIGQKGFAVSEPKTTEYIAKRFILPKSSDGNPLKDPVGYYTYFLRDPNPEKIVYSVIYSTDNIWLNQSAVRLRCLFEDHNLHYKEDYPRSQIVDTLLGIARLVRGGSR